MVMTVHPAYWDSQAQVSSVFEKPRAKAVPQNLNIAGGSKAV